MKVLIVAEGDIDPGANEQRKKGFVDLWTDLIKALCPDAVVAVRGFNKASIVTLDLVAAHARGLGRGAVPLDLVVKSAWLEIEPDLTIIAFDRWPANQLLQPAADCRPGEVAFILDRLIANNIVPAALITAAQRLRAHYQTPGHQRTLRAHPEALEIVCMDPEFEALPASDEAALKKALGFASKPTGWPWNRTRAVQDPKGLLAACIKLKSPPNFMRRARGDFLSNPHGWAHAFIQAAKANGETSTMFSHPLATRLRHKAC